MADERTTKQLDLGSVFAQIGKNSLARAPSCELGSKGRRFVPIAVNPTAQIFLWNAALGRGKVSHAGDGSRNLRVLNLRAPKPLSLEGNRSGAGNRRPAALAAFRRR